MHRFTPRTVGNAEEDAREHEEYDHDPAHPHKRDKGRENTTRLELLAPGECTPVGLGVWRVGGGQHRDKKERRLACVECMTYVRWEYTE